jgi:hypothetical protein
MRYPGTLICWTERTTARATEGWSDWALAPYLYLLLSTTTAHYLCEPTVLRFLPYHTAVALASYSVHAYRESRAC